MKKLCLISNSASHYRLRIYRLMQEKLNCNFIFGVKNTSVKRLDTSCFNKSIDVPNKPIGNSNWYYQPNLLKLTKEYEVIINDLGVFCISAWLLLLKSKLTKQKIYNWDHGWYGRESLLKKWIKRAYFGLADGALIYGNYARQLMIENGFDGSKLFVIHNSLDYDAQLKLRNEIEPSDIYTRHFGNENKTLIFIGRLTEVKRLDMLIQAVAKLKQEDKQYNIVLVGDGVMKDVLQKQAAEAGVDVWFYGACYDERTNAELIYNADLCVAPGNVGLTAMHTMVFGTPVITHDDFKWQMPEFEAIKSGETGDFFTRGDVNSLAQAIEHWFDTHGNDRNEVRRACYNEIDTLWTPQFQIEVIKKAINE